MASASADNNYSRFNLPEYNKLFEEAKRLPDGPARTALYRKMSDLIVAYAPWHMQLNRVNNTLTNPWVMGYKQHAFNETTGVIDHREAQDGGQLNA